MSQATKAREGPGGLPPPPVPPDADLRQFRFFPIDIHRLLTSETWVLSTGDEAKAAMTLWLQAMHQVPAGSLPDSDRMLSHLSMAGANWPAVKEIALRGWVLHADGRLYHQVVTEKVVDALSRKAEHREKMRAWREKRRGGARSELEAHPSGDDHVTITERSRDGHVAVTLPLTVTGTGTGTKTGINKNTLLSESGALPGIDPPAADPASDSPKPLTYPAAFESFWAIYPRREGKKAAFTAWQVARKQVDQEALLAAVSRYAKACLGKEARFIAQPRTWLHQGRWDDQPATAASTSGYVPMAPNGG